MFKGKTAWFSHSVGKEVTNFWVSEGGAVCSWKAADYLFSDDSSSLDTKRIFYSEDYIKNRATVFHSNFLSACLPRQSVTSVPIGHYVLPPEPLQKDIRALIGRFIWEKEGKEIHEEQIKPEVSEDLQSGSEAEIHCVSSQEDYRSVASLRKVCSHCDMHQYPVNNMFSGYIYIDQMKKYLGELFDFLPSVHGQTVSRCMDASHHRRL